MSSKKALTLTSSSEISVTALQRTEDFEYTLNDKELNTHKAKFLPSLRRAFDAADTNKDGQISLDEWLNSSIAPFISDKEMTKEAFRQYFMRIDVNCDGYVSWAELIQFMMSEVRTTEVFTKQESIQFIQKCNDVPIPNRVRHREQCKCSSMSDRTGEIVTLSADSIRFWDANTLHFNRAIIEPANFATMSVLECGILAVATVSRRLMFYNLETLGLIECDMRASPSSSQIHRMTKREAASSLKVLGSKRVPLFNVPSAMRECFQAEYENSVDLIIGDDCGYIEIFRLMTPQRRQGTDYSISKVGGKQIHEMCITMIAAIPSMDCYASSSHDGTVKFWTFICGSFNVINVFAEQYEINSFVYYPPQKVLVTCGNSRDAYVWSTSPPHRMFKLGDHYSTVQSVMLYETSASENYILTMTTKNEFRFWDSVNFRLSREFNDVVSECYTTTTFDKRRHALIAVSKRPVRWTEESSVPLDSGLTTSVRHPVVGVHYVRDFGQIVVVDCLCNFSCFNLEDGKRSINVKPLRTPNSARILASTLDINERRLITMSADSEMSIWNFSNGELIKRLPFPHEQMSTVLQWSNICGRNFLVRAGWGKTITLYIETDPYVFDVARVYEGHTDDIVLITEWEHGIVSGGALGQLMLWQLDTSIPQASIKLPEGIESMIVVDSLLFCCYGRYLAVYSLPHLVEVQTIKAHELRVNHIITTICYIKQSKKLITGDTLGYIRQWTFTEEPFSLEGGELLRRSIDEICFMTPLYNGQYIALCSADKNIRLWEVETFLSVGLFSISSHWNLQDKSTWEGESPYFTDRKHFLSLQQGVDKIRLGLMSQRSLYHSSLLSFKANPETVEEDEEEDVKKDEPIDFQKLQRDIEERLQEGDYDRPQTSFSTHEKQIPRKMPPVLVTEIPPSVRYSDLLANINGLMERPSSSAEIKRPLTSTPVRKTLMVPNYPSHRKVAPTKPRPRIFR